MSRAGVHAVGLAVLAAAAGASPAASQDVLYSDAATQTCLGAARDAVVQEACIGASANACMQANAAGSTTVGMGACIGNELAYWDGLLNAYYKVAVDQARKMDADTRRYIPEAAVAEQALRDMQRAWIPYRDATCAFERAQWGGGSGGGPAAASCLMEMTGKQALALGRFGYGQ